MTYYALKIAITCALVVLISEISRRSTLAGAILASVPIVSVLAMVWLYLDTRDVAPVNDLSRSIVWLVLPSLVLFMVLPWLTERGLGFFPSLMIAIVATIVAYLAALAVARLLGFQT